MAENKIFSVSSPENKTSPTSSPKSQQTDPFENPYSLHHSDNPTAVLVSPLLNDDNYSTWVRAMTMALRAKNKLGFVDGSIPTAASTDKNYSQWIRVNDMVTSWLIHSISQDLASSVIYAASANEIWSDLEDRFSEPNTTKVYQIKQEITDCKQGKLSVSAYFTKLKSLWDELSSYVSLPTCTCGVSSKFVASIQQDHGMKFLQGLRESYAPLRSQLLLNNPLPAISKLYSLALQEERQREISSTDSTHPEAAALASTFSKTTSQTSPSSSGQKGRPHCDHCNMDGHTIQVCYKLHGYLPKKNVATATHCDHCNKDGHTIATCYRLHGFPPKKGTSPHLS